MSGMIAITNAFWLSNGLLIGGDAITTFRGIASVAQGETDFLALVQAKRLYSTIRSCFYMLSSIKGYDGISLRQRVIAITVGYSIPLALQMVNHRLDVKKHPLLKKSIVYLRKHTEHLILITDLAMTAVYAYYMAPIAIAGMAIGFTIEALHERKALPAKINAVWEKAQLLFSLTAIMSVRFVFKEALSPFMIVHFLGLITIFGWEHYFENNTPPSATIHRLAYDEEKISKLIKSPEKFQVNWQHVQYDAKLVSTGASDVKIRETMEVLINKVEWNEGNLNDFRGRLLIDERFRLAYPDKTSPADIPVSLVIEIFTTRARLLAMEIAESSIAKGDSFIRYDIVQAMLKSDLKSLNEAERDFEGDLFQIAIEGGGACAVGSIHAIENVYERRILRSAKIPLQTKLLYQLNVMRMRWFEGVYARLVVYANKLPKGIIDPVDVHFRNLVLFYFDKPLKLYTESIKNDMTLALSGLCDYFYRALFTLFMNYTFWPYALKSDDWYSSNAVSQEIAELTTSLGLSGKEVSDWWDGWFEKQSDAIKVKLQDEVLLNGSLFEQPLSVRMSPTDGRQMINPAIVRLMLLDMGILQEKNIH